MKLGYLVRCLPVVLLPMLLGCDADGSPQSAQDATIDTANDAIATDLAMPDQTGETRQSDGLPLPTDTAWPRTDTALADESRPFADTTVPPTDMVIVADDGVSPGHDQYPPLSDAVLHPFDDLESPQVDAVVPNSDSLVVPPDQPQPAGDLPLIRPEVQSDGAEPDVGPQTACLALHEGNNTDFVVDGMSRSFRLHLPPAVETGGPWPVIFNWHGYGDTAANMSGLLSGSVGNADYPFLLVTPEDTNLQPPSGMDWAILNVSDGNREGLLFDAIVDCLDLRYGVDPDRIHMVGFSAGAIASDMLAVIRGDQIASVISFSGAYFSDPQTKDMLGSTVGGFISWPDLTTTNPYSQLISFGGPQDQYNLVVTTLHFDLAAGYDADYLNARGHDIILCNHGLGHTIPAGLQADQIIAFFAAHPRGQADSPYVLAGLPDSFPAYCEIHPHVSE